MLLSLKNWLSEFPTPTRLQSEYEQELQAWIQNGWLLLYPKDKVRPLRRLIPLMAVLRENKQKFHPVMDNYELNEHINAYTAGADICAHRLREWQRQGVGPLLWCWTVAGPTYKYTLKGHCGCFRPWGPDTALLDWCLVSTWLQTS